MNSLSFGTPITSENEDYRILPVSMNIESSRDNFFKFLEYIGNSGAIQNQTRLMDIQSIGINFGNDKKDKITFDVQANAYFQKEY